MTYVVAVKWMAKPGEAAEVERCLRGLVGPTRAEPGVLVYQPHRDPADPSVFYLYEHYVDEAAYAAHAASPHVQALGLGDAIPRLSSRIREIYVPFDR
jgi:quinol monooxygenase YgiN